MRYCCIILFTLLISRPETLLAQKNKVSPFTVFSSKSGTRTIQAKQQGSLVKGQPTKNVRSSTAKAFQNIQTLKGQAAVVPDHRTCFTVESEKILQQKFPKRLTNEKFEERLSNQLAGFTSKLGTETVYKIPTIVHVINYGEPVGTGTNISREQVMSQFDALNEDFRKVANGYNEHPRGADVNIEFVPALVDPQGNPLAEPGIDRVIGYSAYYDYYNIELELKPNTYWNPDQYLNIWVVNFGGDMSYTLGYAQFPSLSGLDGMPEYELEAQTDGVVIGYKYFGRTSNVQAPFNLGRTTTHEVGHWLGLRHIWGDGNCSVDDYCADTPNADGPNQSCEFRDSCPEDGPDMIENYMDYSDDGCMNIFTIDQRTRMRTVLDVSPRRNSLIACQQAEVASVGANFSNGRKWFEYTASSAEVVTISSLGTTEVDTKLTIYYACNALPVNTSDNAFGTNQSALSIALDAGETMKILWEGIDVVDNFQWNLSTDSPSAGAACELAVEAVEGNNQTPATSLNTYWFKFISSGSNKKVTIDNKGKYFAVYGNQCDQLVLLSYGNTPETIYDVAPSETLYIAFDAEGGDFNWSLATENSRPGETCADATLASTGLNVIPYTSPFQYWYTYTMPQNGELSISADVSGQARLTVYETCGGATLAASTDPSIEPVALKLSQGQTVKILWTSESGAENFEWHLQATAFTNGEVCSVAKVASVGTNTTGFAPQWFTYTTTKKTNLRISSVGMTNVDTHLIIKRSCEGPIVYDNDNASAAQSEILLYGLNAGETLLILWSEKWSYEGFDWVVEEINPKPGDNCQNAKKAVVGTNTVQYNAGHSNFGNIYWTKFTVPASGKKITAYSSIPVDVAIYTTNNCETFSWLAEDQGKAQVFNLPAGQEILIIWDGSDYTEDFTWQLSVENIAQGDLCYNPKKAVKGINTSQYTGVWYEYTMTQSGSLKFSAVGLTDRYAAFTVFNQCNGEVIYSNAGEYNKLPPDGLLVGLNKGDKYLIYWTVGYPFTGVTWSLEEVPTQQGDICSNPLPATYGLNHAEYATQWYTYTAQKTGNLKISSRVFTKNDTDLYIYDGCDGTLLAHSDDIVVIEEGVIYFQSEAFLENIEEGQTLLIKWAGTWNIYPFSWEISDDQPRQGDSCDDPLTAIEGVNNAMKPNPTWFTFTMPSTTSLTISSLGYTDHTTSFEIYDACDGNLLASDDFSDFSSQTYIRMNELVEGQTILIKCFNSPWTPSERYTFDWRLIVGEPEPGLFCGFPAEAQIGTNVTPAFTSEFYWYSFTMPASNKKLVIKRKGEPGNHLRSVGVVSGCDWFGSQLYGKGEDLVEVTGLAEGEQILIYWIDGIIGERPENEWELSVIDLESGDACELAEEAWPGLNYCEGPTTWYTYTLPRAGSIRISSKGMIGFIDTKLEVYDACNGTLIAANDNPDDYSSFASEVFIEQLEAGQTILIRWSQGYGDQSPFNWRLLIEDVDNNSPVLEDAFFQIVATPQNDQVVGMLEAYDEDHDELYYRILSGNEDGVFELHPNNGALTIRDATKISSNGIARELHVVVTDRIENGSAKVSVDIITASEGETDLTMYVYPNPAKDKMQLQIPANVTVYVSMLMDLNGQVVMVNDPDQRELWLHEIKQGIYYLKLVTSAGQQVVKIAVVK